MSALIKYEAARIALAEARSLDDVKDLRDKAAALAAYARQAQDTTLILAAQEIKVRAERRAGEMLSEAAKSGQRQVRGGDGSNQHKEQISHDASTLPTLEEIGITKDQSSRWQTIASIPEEFFESIIQSAKDEQCDLTSAAFLRLAKDLKKRDEQTAKAAPKTDTTSVLEKQSAAKPSNAVEHVEAEEVEDDATPVKPFSLPPTDEHSSSDEYQRESVSEDPEDYGPSEEELEFHREADRLAMEALNAAAHSDDKLAGALEQIKLQAREIARLNAVVAGMQERQTGLMNEKTQLVDQAKRWRRIAEKAGWTDKKGTK